MKEFDSLRTIFTNYKSSVDALSREYLAEVQRDSRYSDSVIAERQQERAGRYNAKVDELAAKATADAMAQVEKLQAALGRYITAEGNPSKIAALQSILAADLTLTNIEADALASGATYMEKKLLEKITAGRIAPPDLRIYHDDLNNLKIHADGLKYYRGEMAAISRAGGLFGGPTGNMGMGATMSSAIVEGWLSSGFSEMSSRWSTILQGGD